jgi:hypothetical protein
MDRDEVKAEGVEQVETRGPRRTRRWIGAGVAVVVVAVAVVVIAQSGGGGSTPLNAIAKAAEVTQREPGGHARVEATIESSATPGVITDTGPMTFDENGRAEGTFNIKILPPGKEVTITTIADGTTSYTSSPDLPARPGAEGKKWIRIDDQAAATAGGAPAANGPKEGLKVLESVEESEKVGEEEIEGVPTTHYRGTFPHAKEVFGVKVDISEPKIDVWVDGQERVRKMQASLKSSVEGVADSAATTKITINYVSFGRVPKIEVPPASEVFDATGEIEAELQTIH